MVIIRRHLNPLTRALAAVFVLSVWVLPVANAMQQQGRCCASAEAHASAETGCDNAGCCYAEATTCCDHSGEADPDSPMPDAPCENDCDCACCGVIAVSPPIAVALLLGGVLPIDSSSPVVSIMPTARPTSAALGVSIPPPII